MNQHRFLITLVSCLALNLSGIAAVGATQTIPLGDPDNISSPTTADESSPAGESSTAAAEPEPAHTAPGLYCRSNNPSLPEPNCVRGVAAAGLQLAWVGKDLDEVTRTVGPGFHFYLGFGPRRSPVLWGLQLDYLDYGGPKHTFSYQGQSGSFRIGTYSHQGLVFMRLAPERYHVRPYLDALAGYWLLGSDIRDGKSYFEDTKGAKGLGVQFVGVYGLRVGVDVLFRRDWGVGFAAQWTRGGRVSIVDVDAIEAYYGELTIPPKKVVPQQLQFMLSYVFDSWGGNWKVGTPQTSVHESRRK